MFLTNWIMAVRAGGGGTPPARVRDAAFLLVLPPAGPIRAREARTLASNPPRHSHGQLTDPWWLIPLTQVTATMALAADLKPPEDESNPWPPKLADHAFGFLCRSLTGPEVGKGGKE